MDRAINFSVLTENSAVWATPLIVDGVVYVGACDSYFYALNQKTGEIAWKFRGKDTATFTPILYKDMLILNSDTVYALKKNGTRA